MVKSYIAEASTEAREYANRIKNSRGNIRKYQGGNWLQERTPRNRKRMQMPSGDVEAEIKIPKEKLEDEEEQKRTQRRGMTRSRIKKT